MKGVIILKIGRVIVYILQIVFLLLCIGLFILLKCCNLSYYVILSGSMRPEINIDDLVVSQNLNERDVYDALNVGDIATYFDGKDYITHRVYEKEIDSKTGLGAFVFKGDSNNTIDRNTVYSTQIKSKYLMKIDRGAYYFEFINSIYGIISLVTILMILFLIDNTLVYSINLKIKGSNKEQEDGSENNVSDSDQ